MKRVWRLLLISLMTIALPACNRMSSEEEILRRGGPEANAVIYKATGLLARATIVSASPDAEANWALSVLVIYENPKRAREFFQGLSIGGSAPTAARVYGFLGYRMLQPPGENVQPKDWFDSDFLNSEVHFRDLGCTGAIMSVQQLLNGFAGNGYETIMTAKPLPPLYMTY